MSKHNLSLMFYKFLYIILHFCHTIFEYVTEFVVYTKHKTWPFGHKLTNVHSSRTYIRESVRTCEKLPTHVTVILRQQDYSLEDVANLIIWCIAAGISFVSFHDSRGWLKNREEKLHLVVDSRIETGEHVIWHGGAARYQNGYIGKKIRVKILTKRDARESVVMLSRQLALSEKPKNISIESVDNNLKKQYEFPDPDLGICCGKTFSLSGCAPWQIRVTEFLNVRTLHQLSVECFVNLLERFSKCDQRLGK